MTKTVKILIIINVAFFVLIHLLPDFAWVRIFGLVPRDILGGFRLWQLFTYMFLHLGLWHLVINMLMLWFFGPAIESAWGRKEFLRYYFFTGIGAGLCSWLVAFRSAIPVIGASGAIFGILVAYAIMYPETVILLFFFFPMKIKHAVLLLLGINLLGALSSPHAGIAYFAHLGGGLFGYLYLKNEWLRWRILHWAPFKLSKTQDKQKLRQEKIERKIDAILDKISKFGMDSLSKKERRILELKSKEREGRKLRVKLTLFLFILVFLSTQISKAGQLWQAQNAGLIGTDIHSISLFPGDSNLVCAAGKKAAYLWQDRDNIWQETFSFKGKTGRINFVTFDYRNPKILYLATSRGLYATRDQGQSWQKIFSRSREAANNVTWVAIDPQEPGKIYIGTEQTLFVSADSGTIWQEAGLGLPHAQVRTIAVHPSNSKVLYLANNFGLFKSIDAADSWKRIYLTSDKLVDEDVEDKEESAEENENSNLINCLVIDQASPKRIFMASGSGVLLSKDAGESWTKMSSQGLSNDYVNFIILSRHKNGTLYAATQEGVFAFVPDLNRWQEIHQGMTALQVRTLALNETGKELFAGTDRGIFKTIEVAIAQKHKKNLQQVLQKITLNEPTIQDVQQSALQYAEVVHPNRIKTLRRNAKLKALLPDVSVDYDKTINYDSGADRYYVGPYDWGFTLSWDVGDLVFSEQVRLLDSNARLMVQLRDDIISQVTRLYYERRKLQTELIFSPPRTPAEELARSLRLEELTANLDGLTGGYFSRHLPK